jgi:hypothetical protein
MLDTQSKMGTVQTAKQRSGNSMKTKNVGSKKSSVSGDPHVVVQQSEERLRNTTAMLNAAIRIVRGAGGPEADCLLWAEQVKSNMAVIAGAPDFSHAQHVVDVEQLNKELYEALNALMELSADCPSMWQPRFASAMEDAEKALRKARGAVR